MKLNGDDGDDDDDDDGDDGDDGDDDWVILVLLGYISITGLY